jgi:cell division protein FtsB
MDNVTWPEAIVVLGIIALIIFLIGGGMATYLDMRKMNVTAQQEDDLRQLVRRNEQLAENSLDAQQRAAADVSELRSRTASIEQILRTVE